MYGHAPCRILLLQQPLYLLSVECHGIHEIVKKLRQGWRPSVFVDITVLKTIVSVLSVNDIDIPVSSISSCLMD